jgi:hypothetical protein
VLDEGVQNESDQHRVLFRRGTERRSQASGAPGRAVKSRIREEAVTVR